MSERPSELEILAATHAAVVLVLASWAFGGSIGWAAGAISWLGSVGILTLAAAIARRLGRNGHGSLRALHCLWPLVAFNVFVLLSVFQPSLRMGIVEGAKVYVPRLDVNLLLPSTGRPELTLRELWLWNAGLLPCFNLLLTVRHRRTLRYVWLAVAINTAVLAVFGTLQKLTSSPGIFFGRFSSPNKTFFASFVYHNHWGAFVVLVIAGCLGLIAYEAKRPGYRNFWHSPAALGLVLVIFLAITVPLSTSRSCTLLVLLLLGAGFVHAFRRMARHRRAEGRSVVTLTYGMIAAAVAFAGCVYWLARPMIQQRLEDTQQQLAEIRSTRDLDARTRLYRDTWHMARDSLAYGWGLGSYGTVFMRYNTRESIDRLPQFYENAHSDWLQLLAETGLVGLSLIAAFFLGLGFLLLRAAPLPAFSLYLLAGCVLILLYAWIEFPLQNSAVRIAFWLSLFTAIRYAQLDEHEHPGSARHHG